MPKDSVRKRCTECKRTYGGTRGKYQTCPECGAEMREAPYGARKRRRRAS